MRLTVGGGGHFGHVLLKPSPFNRLPQRSAQKSVSVSGASSAQPLFENRTVKAIQVSARQGLDAFITQSRYHLISGNFTVPGDGPEFETRDFTSPKKFFYKAFRSDGGLDLAARRDKLSQSLIGDPRTTFNRLRKIAVFASYGIATSADTKPPEPWPYLFLMACHDLIMS